MLLTLLLSFVFIIAVLGALYAAVALIQNKKLFTTAPKDIQAAAKEHPERFHGAHALGWTIAVICLLMMIGSIIYGGYDGVKNGFGFWQFFLRFLLILYIWKAFDNVCLDWLLLTTSIMLSSRTAGLPSKANSAVMNILLSNWEASTSTQMRSALSD